MKRILLLILALTIMFGLVGCASNIEFTVDENGYVSWEPVRGAVQYECAMVDGTGTTSSEGYFLLDAPGYQLQEGHCLHVNPVLKSGRNVGWSVSDFYGENKYAQLTGEDGSYDPTAFVNMEYDLRVDSLSNFEIISAIIPESISTDGEGILHFEVNGPHGVMRFEGEGVSYENGELVFNPGGKLYGLDAIGRICILRPTLSDAGDPDNLMWFSGGFTFSEETSVESYKDLMYALGSVITAHLPPEGYYPGTELMNSQPNFVVFGNDKMSVDEFRVSSLEVFYDTESFTTDIRHMVFESQFSTHYLSGELYDPSTEIFDIEKEIFTFYLGVVPDVGNELERYEPVGEDCFENGRANIEIPTEHFKTGTLRFADGTETGRDTPLEVGMTIDVTVGAQTLAVPLIITEQYKGAENFNELRPYTVPEATGELNSILVPVYWQDQPENATDENYNALLAEVGRVIGRDGSVKDHSDGITENRFSLSEYFDIASYGKLEISTFVTDWFEAPFNYSEYEGLSSGDEAFYEAVCEWLMNTYSDMDWSDYDKDEDGYFDNVMFVNVGTSDSNEYYSWSFAGGAQHTLTYNSSLAGTPEKPTVNSYLNVNFSLLKGDTLKHETGHIFGLIDYYDVTNSGIDAVGQFDMQSASYGDWNSYSKYAAGWITPEIASLKSGESKEYTIGAFAETGDAIVVPVDPESFDGPFNEYIMIDLFTDGGVNEYDAEFFGLGGASGVRIYHIDARMEVHTEEANGVSDTFGTPAKVNSYNPSGIYHVELIQAGKDNTFTDLDNLREYISTADFFRSGDVFTIEDYSEFFRDGRTDSGYDFPYIIEIVSANAEEAVVRITAK